MLMKLSELAQKTPPLLQFLILVLIISAFLLCLLLAYFHGKASGLNEAIRLIEQLKDKKNDELESIRKRIQ